MTKILYAGLQCTPESKQILKDYVESDCPFEKYKVYCDHSTLAFGIDVTPEIEEYCRTHKEEVRMKIVAVGYSNKAWAVKVEHNAPCVNKLCHITLATNLATGGKPVDSNYITKWTKLHTPVLVYGVPHLYTT